MFYLGNWISKNIEYRSVSWIEWSQKRQPMIWCRRGMWRIYKYAIRSYYEILNNFVVCVMI